MDNMTDNQMKFIAWLITTIVDKRETLEEVRNMNEQIRERVSSLLYANVSLEYI